MVIIPDVAIILGIGLAVLDICKKLIRYVDKKYYHLIIYPKQCNTFFTITLLFEKSLFYKLHPFVVLLLMTHYWLYDENGQYAWFYYQRCGMFEDFSVTVLPSSS